MRQLHARQFAVTSSESPPVRFYTTLELAPDRYLHHDPALHLVRTADEVFIGDLPLFGDDTTLADARKAGGRWALVWPVAKQSAMALLSLYWAGSGDELVVSSSSSLLAQIVGATRTDLRVSDYRPNWISAPSSGYEGVRRLIRDQMIDMRSGEVAADPSNQLRPSGDSIDERAATLEQSLRSQLRQASRLGNLKLALTAGYDSRTLFAAALAENLEFETYTQSENSPEGGDITTAAALSKQAGVRHHAIGPGTVNRSAAELWDAQTGGAVRDADRRFLRRGMFDLFDQDEILIRGGMFEIGAEPWESLFPGVNSPEFPESQDFERLVSRAYRLLPLSKSFVLPALQEWRSYRLTIPSSIGWRDHLYTDQRGSGWLGGIEQGLGLLEPRSLQLADTSEVIDMMTWEPEDPDHASGREIQKRALALMDESLLNVPFNPSKSSSRAGEIASILADLARGELRIARAAVQSRLRA